MARDPVLDPSGLARATERLAALVPGYSGYKAREAAREEDRAIREAVSRGLGLAIGRLERALKRSIRSLPPDAVEEADTVLRALGRHRDRIRFAPGGYASLFSRKAIQESTLEALVTLDASLWASLEALDRAAAAWDEASRQEPSEWPGEAVTRALYALEETLDERESLLRS